MQVVDCDLAVPGQKSMANAAKTANAANLKVFM